MKKILFIFLLMLFSISTISSAQDTMLTLMKNKSDIIVHVNIIEIQGGAIEEVGVEEWSALCKIVQTIKGKIEKDEKIRFHFNRFVLQDKKEPFVVEKGKEYVIFLKGTAGGIKFPSDNKPETSYSLLDRWIGVLRYDQYLVERLDKYIEDK